MSTYYVVEPPAQQARKLYPTCQQCIIFLPVPFLFQNPAAAKSLLLLKASSIPTSHRLLSFLFGLFWQKSQLPMLSTILEVVQEENQVGTCNQAWSTTDNTQPKCSAIPQWCFLFYWGNLRVRKGFTFNNWVLILEHKMSIHLKCMY